MNPQKIGVIVIGPGCLNQVPALPALCHNLVSCRFYRFAAPLRFKMLQRDRVFGIVSLLPHTKAGIAMRHCRCIAKGASGKASGFFSQVLARLPILETRSLCAS